MDGYWKYFILDEDYKDKFFEEYETDETMMPLAFDFYLTDKNLDHCKRVAVVTEPDFTLVGIADDELSLRKLERKVNDELEKELVSYCNWGIVSQYWIDKEGYKNK